MSDKLKPGDFILHATKSMRIAWFVMKMILRTAVPSKSGVPEAEWELGWDDMPNPLTISSDRRGWDEKYVVLSLA